MKKAIVAVVLAVCLLTFQGLTGADTIEMKNGDLKLKVSIVEEGLHKVIFKKAGLPQQQIPSDKVKDVQYFSTSNDFKTAVEAYQNKEYGAAAEMYMEYAATLSEKKQALMAHCDFRVAFCYHKIGNWKEAAKAYTAFANNYTNHRLYPVALRDRAFCYAALMQNDKAISGFKTLQQQVEKKNLGDFWKHESKYWLILMGEGRDPKRALRSYQDLYKATEEDFPEVANKARLRIGRVMIDQKKHKEAFDFFNQIIENRIGTDRDVIAGAFLGRGLCTMMKKGSTETELKNALYDLLRVVVSYKDAVGSQPEAMYFAGKCYQMVGGKDSTKRWQRLFRRLQKEWPGSSYATKAGQEL